jgi:hypothetical protein
VIEKFERSGVSFQYPANWTLEEEADGEDWVATLQTPGSAVMIVTYREDMEPADLGDETLEALQEEYPELDSEIAVEKLAGQTAIGYDIDFITLDLPVTAKVRALDTPNGALLLFWQVSELDRGHYEPLLNAIIASTKIDEE